MRACRSSGPSNFTIKPGLQHFLLDFGLRQDDARLIREALDDRPPACQWAPETSARFRPPHWECRPPPLSERRACPTQCSLPVCASAFSVPDRMWPISPAILTEAISVVPASAACSEGAAPLNGTCVMSISARSFNNFDRELRDAAETGRGISELARIGFCFRDQIGDADDARGRPGDDGVGRSAEIGDRREILERVVGDFSDARIDQAPRR